MSGFLSRLAARIGGAPGSATPRVPTRFGHSEILVGVPVFALTTSPTVPDRRGERSEVRGTPQGLRPTPPVPVGATHPPHRPAAPVPNTPTPVRPESHPELHADRVATALGSTVSVSRTPSAGSDQVVSPSRREPTLPQVRAVPALPAVMPLRPALTVAEPASAADRGPDVVHISIGRVEVRAAAPAPAVVAPAPSRPDHPAPALSLSDYLRGERVQR
jgi:hypothetical protein